MTGTETFRIATLRGPSAVGMVRMMDLARRAGGPEITVLDEPAQMMGRMAEGSVDFAVLPAALAETLRDRGPDYRVAAIMIWGGLYVCGPSGTVGPVGDAPSVPPGTIGGGEPGPVGDAPSVPPGDATPAAIGAPGPVGDLKGATINVMAGTPPEKILRHLLAKAGIDPDRDVRFDGRFSTHRDLADAAAAGVPGLYVLPEPFVSSAIAANPDLRIILDIAREWQRAGLPRLPVTAFLCRGSLADACPDRVRTLTAALCRSCEWVKKHPARAAALVSEMGIFSDAAVVESSIPRSGFDVVDCLGKNW